MIPYYIITFALGFVIGDIFRSVKNNVEKQCPFDAMQKQQLEFINAKPTNDEFPEKYIMPIKKVSQEEAQRIYPKRTYGNRR